MRLGKKTTRRIAGVLGICLILAAVWTAFGISQRYFIDSTELYVTADRGGLLLDKGAKVKLYGQPIGIVSEIDLEEDNSVRLTLEIDDDQIHRVPSGTRARLTASTVFGAKQVDLVTPRGATDAPIAAGTTIPADSVGTEINDVMTAITEFATAVRPARLNATLGALATALDGRGEQMGQLLADSGVYLRGLNSAQTAFNNDLALVADVLYTYTRIAPDVINIADDATVTGNTLVENDDNLRGTLRSIRRAADDGSDLLSVTANPLNLMLTNLLPVLELTDQYGAVVTCTIRGLGTYAKAIGPSMGGGLPGVTGVATFIPGQSGYDYPKNLPKFVEPNRPECYNLPVGGDKPPHYMFDDGTADVYGDGSNGPPAIGDPITIYSDLVEDFFGESGLNLLLDGE